MTGRDAQPDRPIDVRHVRRVMFVCLGNICRSPLAQGVFEHIAEQRGVLDDLVIASSGTGNWHVGNPPDPRSIDVARKHGVPLRSRAQQLAAPAHFDDFDLLLAMDRSNLQTMLRRGCPPSKAALFLSFAPPDTAARHPDAMRTLEVPDPYYGGLEGFDVVYDLVYSAADGLLSAIVDGR
jgi:protein-tyrosine phosphatase